jgi:hypothetical protein
LFGNWNVRRLENKAEGLGAPVKIFDNPLSIARLVI